MRQTIPPCLMLLALGACAHPPGSGGFAFVGPQAPPDAPRTVVGETESRGPVRVPGSTEAAPQGTATRPAPSPDSDRIAQAWDMPWTVAPATERTEAERGDVSRTAQVPGWGLVKATPRVLASLRTQPRAVPGRNRAVEACRRQAQRAAIPFGPASVTAVSRGPDHATPAGAIEGLVELRIVYRRPDHVEVRQDVLRCTVDARGGFLDAKPASEA